MKTITSIFVYLIFSVAIVNSQSADEYYQKGLFLHSIGKFSEAVTMYDKAIKLDPNHYGAYMERASERLITYDFQGALDDCNKCVELHPDRDSSYLMRGIIYSVNKNFEKSNRIYLRRLN